MGAGSNKIALAVVTNHRGWMRTSGITGPPRLVNHWKKSLSAAPRSCLCSTISC
jgi:hypothetical protein